MTKTVVQTHAPTTPDMIEEIQRRAEMAPEPRDPNADQWVHQADGEVPVNIAIDHVRSAGYRYIYDTRTGDRSSTNLNMLEAQLKKKREDGSVVFSLKKPDVEPVRGQLNCLLHPDDPHRAEYDALGLPVCDRDGVKSPYQVTQHMKHRHSDEWAAIEAERVRAEREADRAFQRELMAAGKAKAG